MLASIIFGVLILAVFAGLQTIKPGRSVFD